MRIIINASQPSKTLLSVVDIGKCFKHEATLYLRLYNNAETKDVDVLNLTTMKLETFPYDAKVTPVFAELKVWGT